ncbi:MAG: isoprenylcysteine carboxylmethyltransferase family protein [Hyphomonadaceae bacterium]|nr:isoprenylcysteine carboxylmethyltransferase family protein [Hyphomonadaceae bacterium]
MTITDRPQQIRRLLDGFERIAISLLFAWLAYRLVGSLTEQPANLLYLASEGLVACFVIFRRSTEQISVRPMDWAIGITGTMLPMLVVPTGGGWMGATVLMLAGLAISLGAKLSLRRSFGVVAANRGVKRTGLYAVVRHPMYLGYFLVNGGMILLNPSLWNAALLAAWTACQIYRIHAEERMLMQAVEYRSHAEKVRFRLVPFVY